MDRLVLAAVSLTAQSAGGGGGVDLGPWLPLLTNAGGVGLMLFLLLIRKLHTHGEFQDLRDDRDAWRTVAEDERELRKAADARCDLVTRNADISVEQGRTTLELLRSLKETAR